MRPPYPSPDILADAVEALGKRVDTLRENLRARPRDGVNDPARTIALSWSDTAPALARFREAREGKVQPTPNADWPACKVCGEQEATLVKPQGEPWYCEQHLPKFPAPLDPAALGKAHQAYREWIGSGPLPWSDLALRAAIKTYLRETGRGA